MEPGETGNFNVKNLVANIYDSSFKTSPEEWAEIVQTEKKLERYGIFRAGEDGKFHSPPLQRLHESLNLYLKKEGPLGDVEKRLSPFIENLAVMKKDIEMIPVREDYLSFSDYLEEMKKLVDTFTEGIRIIRMNLITGDETAIREALSSMEEVIRIRSTSGVEGEKGGKKMAVTKFTASRGNKKCDKVFTSPCYDVLNNALKEFRDGDMDEKNFRDAVTESQHPMEAFAAFFKEEIEPLREVDPDHYGKYKEVAATINKAQSLSREAWENLERYFEEKNEELLTKGMETFFKAIHEMAGVYILLDQLKKTGL
ncbi:MAG: hypothetical protein AB9903_30705 [Vulcanimicrobiota bacterium]